MAHIFKKYTQLRDGGLNQLCLKSENVPQEKLIAAKRAVLPIITIVNRKSQAKRIAEGYYATYSNV
jgi:hypothetical protein